MTDDTEQPGVPSAPETGPEASPAAPPTSEPTQATAPVPALSPDPAAPAPPVAPPNWPLAPTTAPAAPAPPVPPPNWPPAPTPASADPPPAPFTYPAYGAVQPAPPPTVGTTPGESAASVAGPAAGGTPPRRGRMWIAVAAVAAVIGAGVGAGVATAFSNNSNGGSNVTIHESNSAPGAAVLSGNVTIPQLVKRVIPAVVSIDVKSKIDGQSEEDEGTGMIATSNGEVITNNHVIELYTQGDKTGSITVTQYGQKKAEPATLIGYNATQDVALLKINGASGLRTVTFGSSGKAQVGDAVVAIGNALGLAAGTPTVTQGIVSALGRTVTAGGEGTESESLQNLIQTDAAINPGNSGGPLIDTAGQVIGMNTAVAGTAEDGTDAQNIGFAIPIAEVESRIPPLQKGSTTTDTGGYLGVDITTLTSALRSQYGFTPTKGAVILQVVPNSPAAKAGLAQGDVIVDLDFTPITSAETLENTVQKDKAGQSVHITYYVGSQKHTTSVTLGSVAEEQQQAQ
jgi:S1-C subfamily serine protease